MIRNENLMMGTWEFEKSYKNLSDDDIRILIKYAKACGIYMFDTALAYDAGRVEKILGEVLDESDYVITKIPGLTKPALSANSIEPYYNKDYIKECVYKSLNNLNRKSIDCVLLHNWAYNWDNNPLKVLKQLKDDGFIKSIGISLPNKYEKILPEDVLNYVDVIEIPYNNENLFNAKLIEMYKHMGKIVFIRSIFQKNKDVGDVKKEINYCKRIKEVLTFSCPIIIGMTTQKQIHFNNLWSRGREFVNGLVRKSIFKNDKIIYCDDKTFKLNNLLFGTLDKDVESPLHCVSVSNNSLSIDIWKGCPFQCRYCHVQGIYEDIALNNKMELNACRRNASSIESIIAELISHPYFIPNESIISIGTSSTEPLAHGKVLDSTISIMNEFVKYGLKNPFWIVTKAGLPDDKIKDFKEIASAGNKIMFSMCYAANPENIEPIKNNRFNNVEKYSHIKNIFISWYLRPMAAEWGANNKNLEKVVACVAKKYASDISYIVPGGLRWTEGIEYALTKINNLSLPKLQRNDNIKTLNDDVVLKLNELCKKYFPNKEVFYNSSCAISRMLGKDNINLSQYLKVNCDKSHCEKRCRCDEIQINSQIENINYILYNLGFNCKINGIDNNNKKLLTKPEYNKLHYVEQQMIKQLMAEVINEGL